MTVLHVEPAPGPTWIQVTALPTVLLERFAADPVASHSARFPLGRNAVPADPSAPSAPVFLEINADGNSDSSRIGPVRR